MRHVRENNDPVLLGWYMVGLIVFGGFALVSILYNSIQALLVSIVMQIFFFINILFWGGKHGKI